MTGRPERWVIHVPVVVPELARARLFARTATRALALLSPRIDVGEVPVSAEDAQGVRHRVFCDRRLPGGGRCTLPTDHTAPCTRRLIRPG